MFFDGLINEMRILKGRAKRRIDDPFFDRRMHGEFADDPMRDLRFLTIACLLIPRKQGANQFMVVAQQLNHRRKGAKEAFQHLKTSLWRTLYSIWGEQPKSTRGDPCGRMD